MTSLLTVYVPPNARSSFEYVSGNGSERTNHMAAPRLWNGLLVIDIPLPTFLSILRGPQGLLWQNSNPEVFEWLATNMDAKAGVMTCNVFPGSKRFAPSAA